MAFKGKSADEPEIDFPEQENQEDNSDVAIARRMWSDNDLREIGSFEDAIAAAGPNVYDSADEIGSGFRVLEDKDQLLKVPFFALEWRFNPGKYVNDYGEKTDFVSITLVTKYNDKYILNDGSTGIAAQLRDFSDRTGAYGGLMCRNGLRVSRDYEVRIPDGKGGEKTILGTTYYLA